MNQLKLCLILLTIWTISAESNTSSNLTTWCAAFKEDTANVTWTGVYKDLFSPDDDTPNVYKFVDMGNSFNYANDGLYHLNEMSPNGVWGKKWDKNTTVDPQITNISKNVGKTSFESKIPMDSPNRNNTDNGALNFTLTYGMVTLEGMNATKVLRWNGFYDGKGGPWINNENKTVQMPASDCSNFWEIVTEVHTKCTGNTTNMYYMPTNMTCLAAVPDNYYSELNVLSPCDPSCS